MSPFWASAFSCVSRRVSLGSTLSDTFSSKLSVYLRLKDKAESFSCPFLILSDRLDAHDSYTFYY